MTCSRNPFEDSFWGILYMAIYGLELNGDRDFLVQNCTWLDMHESKQKLNLCTSSKVNNDHSIMRSLRHWYNFST